MTRLIKPSEKVAHKIYSCSLNFAYNICRDFSWQSAVKTNQKNPETRRDLFVDSECKCLSNIPSLWLV